MILVPMCRAKAVESLDLLVVDDNELTLEIIAWSLRDTGISYQLCEDAVEALDVLSKNMPRMLVVDYFMPVMDGLELLEQFIKLPQADACATFLCSSVKLTPEQLVFLGKAGAELISKDKLCNKASLLKLVRQPPLLSNG